MAALLSHPEPFITAQCHASACPAGWLCIKVPTVCVGCLCVLPPSGKRMRWESIRIFGFDGGKITKTWAMQDRLGLMEQLGAVTSSAGDVTWAGEVDGSKNLRES